MEQMDDGPGGTPRFPAAGDPGLLAAQGCPAPALPEITSTIRLWVAESRIFPEQMPVGTKQGEQQIL